jgi:Zn-dependent protease with chaperone function/lipoprotein NlpI
VNSLTSTSDSEPTPDSVSALYYDGRSALSRPVWVRVGRAAGGLELQIQEGERTERIPLVGSATAGRVGQARHLLPLPDGGTVEIIDGPAFAAALAAAGHEDGERLVRWLERSWLVAVMALLVLLLGSGAFLAWGLPALANRALAVIPHEVDQRIGTQALNVLDRSVFKLSKLPTYRQAQLRAVFAEVTAAAGPDGRQYRLEFRQGGRMGANAFALPSGIVVMTDELVALAHNDEELRGVLAHETGHLVHRHAMRQLLQSSVGALLMVSILGDVSAASTLVAGAPGVLLNAAYSRDFEREADAFAVQWMRQHGVPPERLAELLTRVSGQEGASDNGLLATHPGLAERVRLAGAAAPSDPESATRLVSEGNAKLDKGEYEQAIADFDMALASDPASDWALADRAMAEVWLGDRADAHRDLEAAARLNGSNNVVFHGRGMLALFEGDNPAAVTAFSAALQIDSQDQFSLGWRAHAYSHLGDTERALADAAEVLEKQPYRSDMRQLRARELRDEGRIGLAEQEAVALELANPQDPEAYIKAASLLAAINQWQEAMRAVDRAVELSPDARSYIARSGYRSPNDLQGRRADIQAALKKNPRAPLALWALSGLQFYTRQYAAAIITINQHITLSGESASDLTWRGIANDRLGNAALARQDIAKAISLANVPADHNNLCWSLATTNTALETALAECDRALAGQPASAGFLDSRGMALLRLGRYADAVESYDAALRQDPDTVDSLYGRGLAERRLGLKEKSVVDIRAAVELNAHVSDSFSMYGL